MRSLPAEGENYRHFKGNEYQIIAVAEHSEDGSSMVVYKALYGDEKIWVRPLSMWNDKIILNDGSETKRFVLVEEI